MIANARLRRRIVQRLRAFEVRPIELPGAQRAAVAVPVVEEGPGADLPGMPAPERWSRRAALMLTRRAVHLKRHAGRHTSVHLLG